MNNTSKKFHFKVAADSDRGKAIVKFVEAAEVSVQRSSDLAKELGAAYYTASPNAVYPGVGIGSLGFRKPQSARVYKRIGRRKGIIEYVPAFNSLQGKQILNRILKLNIVGAKDFREAFNIPEKESFTPEWFRFGEWFYLSSRYELGSEYTAIAEEEYQENYEDHVVEQLEKQHNKESHSVN